MMHRRMRDVSSCAISGSARMRAYIVGTPTMMVTSSRASISSAAFGVNAGNTVTAPPATSWVRVVQVIPPTWLSGWCPIITSLSEVPEVLGLRARRGEQAPVGEHRSLGHAGGPGGVEDDRGVGRGHLGRGGCEPRRIRCGAGELAPTLVAVIAEKREVLERRKLPRAAELRVEPDEAEVGMRARGDEHLRSGLPEHVDQLALAVDDVERDEDGADPAHREQRRQPLEAVGRGDGDAIAVTDAEVEQTGGEAVDRCLELDEAHGA